MADRRWRRWETAGLFAVLIAGNLLHFAYERSGGEAIAAAFSSVNESTWEHMKLFAVPWILWSLVSAAAQRGRGRSVAAARMLGLLTGMAAIPLLYYTYRGITGQNVTLVNVLIFQAAVLLAFWVSYQVQKRRLLRGRFWQMLGVIVLLGVWAVMLWWTYHPPALPIFMDPLTGLAGIPPGS